MKVHYENEVLIDEDPAVAVIILTHSTQEEIRSHMNIAIKLGNDENSVHTVYFDDYKLGIMIIERNNVFTMRVADELKAEAMAEAIMSQIEIMHLFGSSYIIWGKESMSRRYVAPKESVKYTIEKVKDDSIKVEDNPNIKAKLVHVTIKDKETREIMRIPLLYR